MEVLSDKKLPEQFCHKNYIRSKLYQFKNSVVTKLSSLESIDYVLIILIFVLLFLIWYLYMKSRSKKPIKQSKIVQTVENSLVIHQNSNQPTELKIKKQEVIANNFLRKKQNNISISLKHYADDDDWSRSFNVPKLEEIVSQDSIMKANVNTETIVAISDWASTAIFSEVWSEIVAKRYIDWIEGKHSQGSISEFFDKEVEVMHKNRNAIIAEKFQDKKMPYFTERKMKEWSFASLIGVSINKEILKLQRNSLWDSIVLVIRWRIIQESKPIMDYEEFWSNPILFWSIRETNDFWKIQQWEINIQDWDIVLVSSDGIGKFILELYSVSHQDTTNILKFLKSIQNNSNNVSDYIHSLKKDGFDYNKSWDKIYLVDDDSTLFYIKI